MDKIKDLKPKESEWGRLSSSHPVHPAILLLFFNIGTC
jgi:hypothetical protein